MKRKTISLVIVTIMLVSALLLPALAAEDAVYAVPTPQSVNLNGEVSSVPLYNIGGSNYIRLRDMAVMLNSFDKQIDVDYDAATRTILINTNKPYSGELMYSSMGEATQAAVSTQSVVVNGKAADIKAYSINGENYFKIRDLSNAINLYCEYNSATNTVEFDTAKPPIGSVSGTTQPQIGTSPTETVTVKAMTELQAALANAAVKTILVVATLENSDVDVAIPAEKTVRLAGGVILRIRNLTVDGAILGDGNYANIWLSGKLTGSGLKAETENGFYGISDGYTPFGWMWTVGYADYDTPIGQGWWPISAVAHNEASFMKAHAVRSLEELYIGADGNGSVSVTVPEDLKRIGLHVYDSANLTIPEGITVRVLGMSIYGKLTVNGTLEGMYSEIQGAAPPRLRLYGDAEVNINGAIFRGPGTGAEDPLRLEWNGKSWGLPAPKLTTIIDSHGYKDDSLSYVFETDSDVIGKWVCVDFVETPNKFTQSQRAFQGTLLWDNFLFTEDGAISREAEGNGNITKGSWTKGFIVRTTNIPETQTRVGVVETYEILEIGGVRYLFVQHKSGDYVIRHMEPKFYVFKYAGE